MEIKATLNNLRISPRKARQVAVLVKGMKAEQAKNQLTFLVKKPAPIILKLLNMAYHRTAGLPRALIGF